VLCNNVHSVGCEHRVGLRDCTISVAQRIRLGWVGSTEVERSARNNSTSSAHDRDVVHVLVTRNNDAANVRDLSELCVDENE
jgi:hypothetical protein